VPQIKAEERIRAALIDLVFERGYANSTLELLLEQAAIDHATFERRFAGLDECHSHVFQTERRRLLRHLARARQGCGSWRERLRSAGYSLFRFCRHDEAGAYFLLVEGRSGNEGTRRRWAEGMEETLELLDQGREELARPDSLSRATAEAIAGALFTRLHALLGSRSLPPEEELVPAALYVAMLPYVGAEAALEELHAPPPPVVDLLAPRHG
jgi:AcrR family transcriptional regulator